MGKFIFNMEKLLDIKRQLQKSKENELSIALKTLAEEENILNDFINQVQQQINDIRNSMIKGVCVNEIKQLNIYLTHLEAKVKKQKKIVNDAKVIADKIREELIKVSKEKEVLEILRQNKYEEYLKEEQKKEEIEVSEIVNYKYIEQKEGENSGSQQRGGRKTNN